MALVFISILAVIFFIIGVIKNKLFLFYSVVICMIFIYALATLFYILAVFSILYLIFIKSSRPVEGVRFFYFTLTILFILGTIAIFASSSLPTNTFFIRNVFSPYLKLALLCTILYLSIKTSSDLKKVLTFYLLALLVEIAVTGLDRYFDLNIAFLKDLYTGIEIPNELLAIFKFKRLYSSSITNSVELTVYLLPIIFLPVLQVGKQKRNMAYLISFFAMFLSLLTWSRTIVLGISVFSLIYTIINLSKLGKFFLSFALLAFLIYILLGSLIADRIFQESRILDEGNILTRMDLMQSYVSKVFNGSFIWGVEEDQQFLYLKYNLIRATSSENAIIETFVRRGMIGGILFLYILIHTFVICYKTIKHIKTSKLSDEILRLTTFLTCSYAAVFIMMNTFLLHHYATHLWIFIFLIFINYRIILRSSTNPTRKTAPLKSYASEPFQYSDWPSPVNIKKKM